MLDICVQKLDWRSADFLSKFSEVCEEAQDYIDALPLHSISDGHPADSYIVDARQYLMRLCKSFIGAYQTLQKYGR